MRKANYSLAEVGLVFLLSLALVGVPAIAAPAPTATLGMVSEANHASRGTAAITTGTAIFDGDTLLTDASGNIRAQLGQSQISMLSNSNVLVHQLTNGIGASLASGTIVFSTKGGETIQVEADGATIQPKNGQPTIAQVSYINANELMLTSKRGDLLVSLGEQTQTINEGASYRMMIQPGSGPAPQGAFSSGHGSFYIVLIAVVSAGAGIGIGYAIAPRSSSPSVP